MADVISNEDGQLMLLTVFLIVIGLVSFTMLLNNMVFSANTPSTGLDASKTDIKDLRSTIESDIQKAIYYSINKFNETADPALVRENFLDYFNSSIETIIKEYAARGASVEVIFNNVTFEKTTNDVPVRRYFVERKNHTFPIGSLVIPMDGNQTNIVKVYGLVYKIVDGSGTSGLNSTSIPIWTILQNPVNNSVPDFYSTMFTNNTTGDNIIKSRKYSGGPFIIDVNDTNETTKQLILAEAHNKSITIHELESPFYYANCVKMEFPPMVAVYPKGDTNTETVMEPYYQDGEVPYTLLDKNDIMNGNLTKYDILTIPHFDMSANNSKVNSSVVVKIVGWVANGGVLHVECLGIDTMDKAVETSSAGSAKPWYGLMGINGSGNIGNGHDNNLPPGSTYLKLIDNSTNGSYFNRSPPMPLAGLGDPGAPYSPLTQTSNVSGLLGYETGATAAFSLRQNPDDVNPATNILGYASYGNGTLTYGDYDHDGIKEPQLIYAEAPYDNGLVVYIAGHNLKDRSGDAEKLIFESFFTASMRKTDVTVVSAKNINVTIKYDDGKVKYEDTFLISI